MYEITLLKGAYHVHCFLSLFSYKCAVVSFTAGCYAVAAASAS